MKHIANALNKKPRIVYFLEHLFSFMVPRAVRIRQRDAMVRRAFDAGLEEEVRRRVDYYNRLDEPFTCPEQAFPLRLKPFAGQLNYRLDLHRYARHFDPALRVAAIFGDIRETPPHPALVKARPIAGDNRNAVLFNLNKIRHFVFVKDERSFEEKQDKLVWRGNVFQPNRRRFMELYFDHPRCDVGHARRRKSDNPWSRPYLTISEQLQNKFVLSLEGNDVATNLKWIMSSNSLCIMCRPRAETWFMEGTLEAGRHYVEIKDDFSDLTEKMDYYMARPDEARAIIAEANRFVERFMNPLVEDAVSLLVLEKYLRLSGQCG